VLALLRREAVSRKPAANAIAVFADPVFDKNDPRVSNLEAVSDRPSSTATDQAFSRLPTTRWEANEIIASVSADEIMTAFGFEASREEAMSSKLNDYRIIHFATHSVINHVHPELSGIVLSSVNHRGQQQNGFLDLGDISNLRLSADLVVLSACDTALGKDIEGEGMIGLTQSFLSVGAQGVVTSLWKVDDRATADLMVHFYKGMLTDRLTPAAALRKAKMQMWREGRWERPYYWAGFILQGDGNRNVAPPINQTGRLSYLYIVVLLPLGISLIGVRLRRRYKLGILQHGRAVKTSKQ
jgi:CHAT domain-containing protein